jgi:hypothetical protein|tara:strand:- start:1105 stop:1404 length:300 start_codon:yes stop_codon:yes gene_type:complete
MPRYKGVNARRDPSGRIHYDTIRLKNPTLLERVVVQTTNYVWKYGDRYYNLANQFYGMSEYWWVIAWWNARPTEANILPGDVIVIPINLERALEALGSY